MTSRNSRTDRTKKRATDRAKMRAPGLSSLSKMIPVFVTSFGFVAFAVVVPSNSSAKHEARIFTQGISIQLDRSSPAYAALEDALAIETRSSAEIAQAHAIEVAPSKPLLAGIGLGEPMAMRIMRDVRREEARLAQEREQRQLSSMALLTALSRALPTIVPARNEIRDVQPDGAVVITNGQVASPVAFRRVLSKAPSLTKPPAKIISQRDLALFFKQLSSAFLASPASAHAAAHTVAAQPTGFLSAGAKIVQSESVVENPNTNMHQVVINGPVEFTGGVAISNSSDRVIVYHELDEEKLEPAQVWLKDAKYEVFVDQPVGRLIGELQSSSGAILGRGEFDLAKLPKLESNTYRVEKISILIGPVPQGISGRTMTAPLASSANPKARSVAVHSAHIQLGQLPFDTVSKKDGTFRDANLVEGSLVVTHADRPGHWGSLAFASAGKPVELAMITDATARAIQLAATGSDHEMESHTSLIWGRITRSGAPVAGAHVDLMTGDAKPVYFNSMLLPDSSLKATGANGLYAFFPVEPGSHAVQAKDGHGVTEPSLVPTDRQTATQVNLELAVTRNAKLRVYDAFKPDWPLAAEVITAGRKRGARVPNSGETLVTFTGGDGILMLDADAGANYERLRITMSKAEKKADFPMIQSSWIDAIKGSMRVNADMHTGVVAGFIRGTASFQVSLESESIGPNTKTLYFNSKGELTAKAFGEAGGGFLILNVPEGFRTVLIQPSSTTKAMAATVLVESRVTNMINKTF